MTQLTVDNLINNSYGFQNNKNLSKPMFRAKNISAPAEQKKDMTNAQKWGIAAGATAATILAVYAIKRGGIPLLGKVKKETLLKKLEFKPLAEHIDFKEATTIEEARKFTQEQLKINDIDNELTLDALNWINKGLTNVSNANRGKVKMPNSIYFSRNAQNKATASMNISLRTNNFGRLEINKNLFCGNMVDDDIKQWMYHEGEKAFGDGAHVLLDKIKIVPKNDCKNLMEKYYRGALNKEEKMELYNTLYMLDDNIEFITAINPIKALEIIERKSPGMHNEIKAIKKLPLKEQQTELKKLLKQLKDNGTPLTIGLNETCSAYRTVYHEMGHLQDVVKNAEYVLSNNPQEELKNYTTRWYRKKDWDKLISSNPEIGGYSDVFKEFIENQDIQQTAGEVSVYAQSGIGEFIADTYASMVEGKRLSEKVKALFKKYNGPDLAA